MSELNPEFIDGLKMTQSEPQYGGVDIATQQHELAKFHQYMTQKIEEMHKAEIIGSAIKVPITDEKFLEFKKAVEQFKAQPVPAKVEAATIGTKKAFKEAYEKLYKQAFESDDGDEESFAKALKELLNKLEEEYKKSGDTPKLVDENVNVILTLNFAMRKGKLYEYLKEYLEDIELFNSDANNHGDNQAIHVLLADILSM